MQHMGFKTAPQGESLGLEFPASVGHCIGDGVYGEIVSQPFLLTLMWFPSCLLRVIVVVVGGGGLKIPSIY